MMTLGLKRRDVLSAAALSGLSMSIPGRGATAESCTAEVSEGRLRGTRLVTVDRYLGVPYAGTVSGGGRFKAPPPASSWAGVREATRLGAPSLQPGAPSSYEPAPSEDCLVLNVWTPRGGKAAKPVMVYSHGGGFTVGSGGLPIVDGANLAGQNDVVVVTTNHRLGALGFLYLDDIGGAEYAGSGNRGIQDIAHALQWIAKNIAAFGGDPNNVMIFGESGGGMKTSCLYAMPTAAPYFHKASIESGPGVRMIEADVADQTTRKLLAELGLDRQNWRKLLDVPAASIVKAQQAIAAKPGIGRLMGNGRAGPVLNEIGAFGAVRDGGLLPHHPFDPKAPAISRDKPLLVGWNEDEQMFFSIGDGDLAAWSLDDAGLLARLQPQFGTEAPQIVAAYRDGRRGATESELFFAIESDQFSGLGSELIAERKARQGGAPAYRYMLTYDQGAPLPGGKARLGAMHALDIVLKFNNVDVQVPGRPPLAGPRPERYAVAKTMSTMWANFARTGKPSASGQPAWPAYDLKARPTMCIDAQCRVEHDPHRTQRLFWERRRNASGERKV